MRKSLSVYILSAIMFASSIGSAAAADEVKLGDLMGLPDYSKYKIEPYLRTACFLQAKGKAKAFSLLRELANKNTESDAQTLVLCRMLFAAKPGSSFRRAAVGAPVLFGGSRFDDWPLEPIAIVDGVPLLVTFGYRLGGEPEPQSKYVDYCIQKCNWNDTQYEPKSKVQQQNAVKKLLSTTKWKGALEDYERKFVESQIDEK